MKKLNAFTVVELLVVIAIIAVLSSAGIVTYVAFTNKAKKEQDIANVTQFNKVLNGKDTLNETPNNPFEVKELLTLNGYAEDFYPESNKNYFYWNRYDDRVYLVKEGATTWNVVYPEENAKKVEEQHKNDTDGKNFFRLDTKYFGVSVDITNTTASSDNFYCMTENSTASFQFTPVGDYLLPNELTVTNATQISWVVETGTLTISNPTDNVSIVGKAKKPNIKVYFTEKTIVGKNKTYQIVTLANKEWIMLSKGGSWALLLARENWAAGEYNRTSLTKYEDSVIDQYMQSLTAPGGILYDYNDYIYDYMIDDLALESGDSFYQECKLSTSRKCYAPSYAELELVGGVEVLSDISFNGLLSYNQVGSASDSSSWTRSAKNEVTTMVVNNSGDFIIQTREANQTLNYRPALRLDISRVDFESQGEVTSDEYYIYSDIKYVKADGSNVNKIKKGESATLKFTPNAGFSLPDSITVTGADFTYDRANGTVTISNPTKDIIISITAKLLPTSGSSITMNIDGTNREYRVIIPGRNAFVVASFDVTTLAHSASYNGGTIDTYLNGTWYDSLGTNKQYISDSTFDLIDCPELSISTNASIANTSNSENKGSINKKAGILNVKYVHSLVNDALTTNNIKTVFKNNTNGIWLSSYSTTNSGKAYYIDSNNTIKVANTSETHGVRPAFTIDLTKVAYTVL